MAAPITAVLASASEASAACSGAVVYTEVQNYSYRGFKTFVTSGLQDVGSYGTASACLRGQGPHDGRAHGGAAGLCPPAPACSVPAAPCSGFC